MVGEISIAEAVLLQAEKSVKNAKETSLFGVSEALRAVREHLHMEVGFVSEFTGDSRVLRHVDSPLENPPIYQGQEIALKDGYCLKVVNGELPQLIPDTAKNTLAMTLPDTIAIPIGSHMSVPIRLSDGSVYGTFCCFSTKPDHSLNERDLSVMRTVAGMVAADIEANAKEAEERASASKLIRSVIARQEPEIAYQPIFGLSDGLPIGAEALARFSLEPTVPPQRWFERAGMVGLRADLEIAALGNAIAGYEVYWAGNPTAKLAVSISASTVMERNILSIVDKAHQRQLTLELIEYDVAEDDEERLHEALTSLRAAGISVAVAGAGSSFSNLNDIMRMRPETLILDIGLTRSVDTDRLKRGLTFALVEYAKQIGCAVLARGIETSAERTTLTDLGIHFGQGHSLARPGSIGEMIRHPGLHKEGNKFAG